MNRHGNFLALLALIAGSACAGDTETSIVVATDSLSVPSIESDSIDQPQDPSPAEDPFLVYGIQGSTDAPATIVSVLVSLVNTGADPVVVRASAGAGGVVLDTVPARDSVLIRIETHADSVLLSASSDRGFPVGSATLSTRGGPQRAAFPR